MSKNIKKLGTTKSGVSYLDKFRSLVTQIGNALGYVRLIRSASLKHNAHVFKYIPDMLSDLKFEKIAQDLGIREETYESMKLFDTCLKNLFK